jgi:hypothetical protein
VPGWSSGRGSGGMGVNIPTVILTPGRPPHFVLASETEMPTLRRTCSKPRCNNTPTPDGRYCKACFAAANRASHERHHKERNARRRTRAAYRDDTARAKDSARAKLFVAIARGKLLKGRCVRCSCWDDVTALILDPTKWREVVWVCRDHRADEFVRLTKPAEIDPAVAWQTERECALAAIAALPEAQQAALRAIAARGPAGMVIAPEAPFFTIRLVQAYAAWRAREP